MNYDHDVDPTSVQLRHRSRDAKDLVTTSLGEASGAAIAQGDPVRLPVSRLGQRNYSGLFWSATTRDHLAYESLLELDRLWLADFDENVVKILTQPFQVRGSDGAVVRTHIPDVLLTHGDGRYTVVDVKPEALLGRPEVAAQFKWTSPSVERRAGGTRYSPVRLRA